MDGTPDNKTLSPVRKAPAAPAMQPQEPAGAPAGLTQHPSPIKDAAVQACHSCTLLCGMSSEVPSLAQHDQPAGGACCRPCQQPHTAGHSQQGPPQQPPWTAEQSPSKSPPHKRQQLQAVQEVASSLFPAGRLSAAAPSSCAAPEPPAAGCIVCSSDAAVPLTNHPLQCFDAQLLREDHVFPDPQLARPSSQPSSAAEGNAAVPLLLAGRGAEEQSGAHLQPVGPHLQPGSAAVNVCMDVVDLTADSPEAAQGPSRAGGASIDHAKPAQLGIPCRNHRDVLTQSAKPGRPSSSAGPRASQRLLPKLWGMANKAPGALCRQGSSDPSSSSFAIASQPAHGASEACMGQCRHAGEGSLQQAHQGLLADQAASCVKPVSGCETLPQAGSAIRDPMADLAARGLSIRHMKEVLPEEIRWGQIRLVAAHIGRMQLLAKPPSRP